MVAIRGSWTLHEAIVNRWDAYSLDDEFKAYWPDDTETNYIVLSENEAQENPPGPYCTYEITPQGEASRMSGVTLMSENETQDHRVEFRIHAKQTATQSAKQVAKALAAKVAAAFDDMAALDISPDSHVVTIRELDFGVREGEREYRWVLPYRITIDAQYDTSALYA